MEELLLGGGLARDKLNVVHQEQVGFPVLFPKGRGGTLGNGGDDLVGEVLAFGVNHRPVREILFKLLGHGVEQVGFSQPGAAVDEQGVVQQRGLCRHRLTGGVGKPVGRPYHKGVEGQLVIPLLKGVGLLRLLLALQLLVNADLEGNSSAEHVVKGLFQQVAVTPQQSLLVKLVGRFHNGGSLGEIQGNRL